jgi:hypothetical protein
MTAGSGRRDFAMLAAIRCALPRYMSSPRLAALRVVARLRSCHLSIIDRASRRVFLDHYPYPGAFGIDQVLGQCSRATLSLRNSTVVCERFGKIEQYLVAAWPADQGQSYWATRHGAHW